MTGRRGRSKNVESRLYIPEVYSSCWRCIEYVCAMLSFWLMIRLLYAEDGENGGDDIQKAESKEDYGCNFFSSVRRSLDRLYRCFPTWVMDRPWTVLWRGDLVRYPGLQHRC